MPRCARCRAYLDCGGGVQQAAARLRIHRTTLYWRLARVTDLLAVDLRAPACSGLAQFYAVCGDRAVIAQVVGTGMPR
jgi:sugar diacid utilization regulator